MSQRPNLRVVPSPPAASGGAIAAAPAQASPAPSLGSDPGREALEEEVADLRDAVFALGDLARRALPAAAADVHVAIQAAAHSLGAVQRALRETA